MKGTLFLTFTESIGKLQLPKVFFTGSFIYLHLVFFHSKCRYKTVDPSFSWCKQHPSVDFFRCNLPSPLIRQDAPGVTPKVRQAATFRGLVMFEVRFSWWRACAIRILDAFPSICWKKQWGLRHWEVIQIFVIFEVPMFEVTIFDGYIYVYIYILFLLLVV